MTTQNTSATVPAIADPMIDLDMLLGGSTPQATSSGTSARLPVIDADRLALVGILVDDSGSMDGLKQAVIDGLKLTVRAFNGAKGSDFYVIVQGFRQTYYRGLLKDIPEDAFASYEPCHNCTPLVGTALELLRELHNTADQYRSMGIPTTVAMEIMTDGKPYVDYAEPSEFASVLDPMDYVVGMGIAYTDDEEAISKYKQLFAAMGVTTTVTPKSDPAVVRHAMHQFSQSVASIAAA